MLCSLQSFSQDIHFTQFYDSPLNLNPSLAGDFDGSFRFTGNFRRQWASISSGPFNTTSLSVDANNFLKIKNLGLGVLLFQDIAGDSRMQDLRGNLALSYSIRLSRDSVHQLRVGLMPGINQTSVDYSDLRFGDQFNGSRFDPNKPTQQTFGIESFTNLNQASGLSYEYKDKSQRSIKAGFAVSNMLQQIRSFNSGSNIPLERRFTLHAQATLPLIPNWYLEPFALYMSQGVYSQLNFGSTLRYDMDPRKFNYRAVFVGLGTRWGDAANLTAGMYYGPWKFGLSYDINYSL
jgi:type IX secretion system PorP/SprF family membrane protein